MSKLETALEFIQNIEQKNHNKSAYEIANMLRGYTRKNYTSRLWSGEGGFCFSFIGD
ncbi:hypothetical protein MC7420_1951 [Coleofasciculus chthonoplastes PCC 7420]|uniref:Uncharacterized protein n=2 Tax=Coleofasciculaceae TaxID=1892251 RepID=B4VMD4_9CYAN|nr:hypothetical protein MC7420_1951 [Coleofasciculus chthonoplastes PCC 7420]